MLVQISDRPPVFVMGDQVDGITPHEEGGSLIDTQNGHFYRSNMAPSDVAERVNNALKTQLGELEDLMGGGGLPGLQEEL